MRLAIILVVTLVLALGTLWCAWLAADRFADLLASLNPGDKSLLTLGLLLASVCMIVVAALIQRRRNRR